MEASVTPGIGARRGLTSTGLKGIALALMVLDHIHYIFGFTGWIPEWFSMLGRLSAPLFLFCAVEGFTHTRSRKTYFLRVYALSVLMTGLLLAMNLLGVLVRPDGFYPMNGIMTTFAVLTIVWQGMDWLGEGRYLRGAAAVILPLAWPMLLTAAMGLALAVFAGPLIALFAEADPAMREIGALSVNDILALEDMPPVPGGDTRYSSLNYIPLEDFRELSRARNAGGQKGANE